MARIRPQVHFTEREARASSPVFPLNGRFTLLENIETGFGNDDRLMEKALDLEGEYEPGEPYATPYPPDDPPTEAKAKRALFLDPESLVGQKVQITLHSGESMTFQSDTTLDDGYDPKTETIFGVLAEEVERAKSVASRRRVLDRQLDRIMDEIDKLEAIGEDVYDNETVLLFRYKHSPAQEKVYDYVAYKTEDRWFLTGYQNEGPLTWDRMIEKFGHGELVEMWMNVGWEKIV